jgi:two-component system response regulator AgrA
MLEVVICEDNITQRNNIKQLIENTILREKLDLNIALCTGSPDEVIEYMNTSNNIGVYFLDVDLKANINGIRLAEKIREKDSLGFIIFTTTHMEMSYLAFKYKVEAMDYIIKDEDEFKQRVNSCLIKAYKAFNKDSISEGSITINTETRRINVKLEDILFIETTGVAHKVRIHEENRQIEFYGHLKELEENLTDNFYRCHKSYIVNKNKIKEIDKKNNIVIMINDEECYASFRYIKGLLA